jgi:hypothetical protein
MHIIWHYSLKGISEHEQKQIFHKLKDEVILWTQIKVPEAE